MLTSPSTDKLAQGRRKKLLFESWWHSGCCDLTLLTRREQPRSLLSPSSFSLPSPPLPSFSCFHAHILFLFFFFFHFENSTKKIYQLSIQGPDGYILQVPGRLSLVQNTKPSCTRTLPLPHLCSADLGASRSHQ